MLFNTPALDGQCDLAAGVPPEKALNPVVPAAVGPLEQCQYLSLPSAELLSFSFFPVARSFAVGGGGKSKEIMTAPSLLPIPNTYLHCSSAL